MAGGVEVLEKEAARMRVSTVGAIRSTHGLNRAASRGSIGVAPAISEIPSSIAGIVQAIPGPSQEPDGRPDRYLAFQRSGEGDDEPLPRCLDFSLLRHSRGRGTARRQLA